MSLELAIKENTEVMRQLIAAMTGAGNTSQKTFVADTKPEPKAETKPAKNKAEKVAETPVPADINSLNLEQLVHLAVLFPDVTEPDSGHIAKVDATINATGDKRNRQADALDSALAGVSELKGLSNAVILDLCAEMVAHWDDIPGISERREFAVSLLSEGKTQSDDEAEAEAEAGQDPKVLFAQAEQLILQLAKGGYRNEAVGILNTFGAKKLGQVPEDKLAEVVALAEKTLAGE
ncbi:hypothetical protein E4V36_07220 [Proteus mirabilis]|uniref:Uncharacterized protein n=1 Tax=Morganella morganii TaxID=582 RepID=A0AAE4JPT7_MORMO|nr:MULTISPECIES: hypothetical protein [Morganellaceae]ELY4879795.1 hypothetical protein [Morganella morganii]MCD4607678.1 hypothetical protein [Proteus mirabilis]MDS0898003.1 hypothetical protein [Morganella morganii]TFT75052.1 hypothetical protein E4V36_07220 [Proteus mirabilis]TFT94785.1 hypothetical protein E4V35_13425 [Proteus mirabilis]